MKINKINSMQMGYSKQKTCNGNVSFGNFTYDGKDYYGEKMTTETKALFNEAKKLLNKSSDTIIDEYNKLRNNLSKTKNIKTNAYIKNTHDNILTTKSGYTFTQSGTAFDKFNKPSKRYDAFQLNKNQDNMKNLVIAKDEIGMHDITYPNLPYFDLNAEAQKRLNLIIETQHNHTKHSNIN